MWCHLAFDPKSLHTSRRRDTKVNTVTSFKLKWLTSLVSMAFLSDLGSLQFRLDAVDYLLGLSDKVRAKDHPLTWLNPVHRCTTLLIIVVVRELSQRPTLVPFVLIVQHTSSKHIFKNLVHSLRLTIGLCMIS
jgi:hypothetical protein